MPSTRTRGLRRSLTGASATVSVVLLTTAATLSAPGAPASASSGDGGRGPVNAPYAFESMQAGGRAQPVGWNPCRPIRVVVNLRGAPRHSLRLVARAIADVESASGMNLHYARTTHRSAGHQPRNGVLIAWTSLRGAPVGLGGSTWTSVNGGTRFYVRGAVTVDKQAAHRMGRGRRLAVLEHELGHAMGLAHVSDRNQLMYPVQHGVRTYADGDRAGLAVLGGLPCQ